MIVLVIGGARSGKSSYAERVASRLGESPKFSCYLATGEAFDEEMKARIAKHKESRGEAFFTVEEPVNLAWACRKLPKYTKVVLVDCLTTWLGNLSYRRELKLRDGEPNRVESLEDYPEIGEWLRYLSSADCNIVMVTNELGMGLVPSDPMSRTFRDNQGILNQKIADVADVVVFMVAGLPILLKGELPL